MSLAGRAVLKGTVETLVLKYRKKTGVKRVRICVKPVLIVAGLHLPQQGFWDSGKQWEATSKRHNILQEGDNKARTTLGRRATRQVLGISCRAGWLFTAPAWWRSANIYHFNLEKLEFLH
jgi:hypothetical protein